MPGCSAMRSVSGLRQLVGIGAWVFPLVLAAVGIMLITGREQHTRANFAGGAALLFVIGIAWWHLAHTTRETEFTDITQGGWIGAALSGGLRALLGDVSSHIFLLLFTIGGDGLGHRYASAAFVRPCRRRRPPGHRSPDRGRESRGAGRQSRRGARKDCGSQKRRR